MKKKNIIIEFNSEYDFIFLEDKDIKFSHPVSDYYFKLDDLSINLFVSLKWIKWGFKFFQLIAENLDDLKNDLQLEDMISQSLQKINNITEENKKILIDDVEIEDVEKLLDRINNFYLNDKFLNIFDQNTKIQIKLKLNLREYLILTNILFPTLAKPKISK